MDKVENFTVSKEMMIYALEGCKLQINKLANLIDTSEQMILEFGGEFKPSPSTNTLKQDYKKTLEELEYHRTQYSKISKMIERRGI